MDKVFLLISLVAIVTSTIYMLYSTIRYYLDKLTDEQR